MLPVLQSFMPPVLQSILSPPLPMLTVSHSPRKYPSSPPDQHTWTRLAVTWTVCSAPVLSCHDKQLSWQAWQWLAASASVSDHTVWNQSRNITLVQPHVFVACCFWMRESHMASFIWGKKLSGLWCASLDLRTHITLSFIAVSELQFSTFTPHSSQDTHTLACSVDSYSCEASSVGV